MTKKIFRHVLLADDDIDDCDFFSDIFSEQFPDLKLSISYNGSKLINLLEGPPEPAADLIFLDLNMPVLSGPECLKKIRESQHLKHHVIVIFTTSSNPADIQRMYELGADYFITKPADYSKMAQLINKAVKLVSENDNRQPAFENFYITI
ncbi:MULTISPECIES: response regulator [Flavobacterium]|uniref:response regulator n=1 Tax=Flavobacterium TaxID=237 RepID=UPI001182F0DA|nr:MULTISPECIES: response regulator [Flavobacterium]MCR4032118.1 response regulator [Flavobacterium panacis]